MSSHSHGMAHTLELPLAGGALGWTPPAVENGARCTVVVRRNNGSTSWTCTTLVADAAGQQLGQVRQVGRLQRESEGCRDRHLLVGGQPDVADVAHDVVDVERPAPEGRRAGGGSGSDTVTLSFGTSWPATRTYILLGDLLLDQHLVAGGLGHRGGQHGHQRAGVVARARPSVAR